jgi:hypothetical protein
MIQRCVPIRNGMPVFIHEYFTSTLCLLSLKAKLFSSAFRCFPVPAFCDKACSFFAFFLFRSVLVFHLFLVQIEIYVHVSSLLLWWWGLKSQKNSHAAELRRAFSSFLRTCSRLSCER